MEAPFDRSSTTEKVPRVSAYPGLPLWEVHDLRLGASLARRSPDGWRDEPGSWGSATQAMYLPLSVHRSRRSAGQGQPPNRSRRRSSPCSCRSSP